MTDFLLTLSNWPMMEILFILGVVLILIDYFFPVDFPAYLGYLCFAGGMFFAVPFTAVPSLVTGAAIWVVLLILHKLWFYKFLTNAHQTGE